MNLHDEQCWLTTDNDHGSYLHGVRTGPITTMKNSDPEAITIGCVSITIDHAHKHGTQSQKKRESLE